MEAQINKFENVTAGGKSTLRSEKISSVPSRRFVMNQLENQNLWKNVISDSVVEDRLRDNSATTVNIEMKKNKKTTIKLKFLDISQPQQWGFNVKGDKPNAYSKDISDMMTTSSHEKRLNTFLDKNMQKSLH